MENEEIKEKIEPKQFRYIVAFNDQTECYLAKDLEEATKIIKEGLFTDATLEAYILTFKPYKTARFQLSIF